MPDDFLRGYLAGLKAMILNETPPVNIIHMSASNLYKGYPREELPDWVEIIACGNVDELEAVIEVAKADIKAEVEP